MDEYSAFMTLYCKNNSSQVFFRVDAILIQTLPGYLMECEKQMVKFLFFTKQQRGRSGRSSSEEQGDGTRFRQIGEEQRAGDCLGRRRDTCEARKRMKSPQHPQSLGRCKALHPSGQLHPPAPPSNT